MNTFTKILSDLGRQISAEVSHRDEKILKDMNAVRKISFVLRFLSGFLSFRFPFSLPLCLCLTPFSFLPPFPSLSLLPLPLCLHPSPLSLSFIPPSLPPFPSLTDVHVDWYMLSIRSSAGTIYCTILYHTICMDYENTGQMPPGYGLYSISHWNTVQWNLSIRTPPS